MRADIGLAVVLGAIVVLGIRVSASGKPTKADIPSGVSREVKALIEQTFSPDPRLRIEACDKLERMDKVAAPAVPFLIQLLGDKSETKDVFSGEVGISAELALKAIGEPAIKPCIVALSQSSGQQRQALIAVLGSSGERAAAEVLAGLLSDPDVDIRRRAAGSLDDCLKLRQGRPQPIHILPILVQARMDRNVNVRMWIARALGDLQDPRVVEPLQEMLNDASESVRGDAAAALGQVPDRRVVPTLLAVLQNAKESESVRCSAAVALGKTADPSVIESLAAVLKDRGKPIELRSDAACGLGYCRDHRALEPLLGVLKSKSEPAVGVRRAAVEAIADLEGERAIPLLTQLAKERGDGYRVLQVQSQAALSLVQITHGAIDDADVAAMAIKEIEAGKFFQEGVAHEILEMMALNGKTRAVRKVARQAIPEGVSTSVKQESLAIDAKEENRRRTFLILASLLYYPLAILSWAFLYRSSLRQRRVRLRSLLTLVVLIAIGVLGPTLLIPKW